MHMRNFAEIKGSQVFLPSGIQNSEISNFER